MEYMRSPVTVNFDVTYRCDANCPFCFVRSLDQKSDFAPLEDLKKLISIFHKNGVLRLNFFGGEPFIHPKIIDLLKHARHLNFFISAVSNGSKFAKAGFVKNVASLIDIIGISLHGLPETHEYLLGVKGSFQRTVCAIENLISAGIKTGINFTVTKKNYHEIEPLIKYIIGERNLQIATISLNRFIPNDMLSPEINKELMPQQEHLEETLCVLRRLTASYPRVTMKYAISFPRCLIADKELWNYIGSCGVGINYCSVNFRGDFKLCAYSGKVIGNVFERDFCDIWHSNSELNNYRSLNWMPEECKRCVYARDCMCGCRATGKACFGEDIAFEHARAKMISNQNSI